MKDPFPNTRFLMIVDGQRRWMTTHACARTLDANYYVEDGGMALDLSDTTMVERPLTEKEKNVITLLSDEWSGMK